MQRIMSMCKGKESTTEEIAGVERFQKHLIRIGLMHRLAREKGSCFEQKLLALDEENSWHSVSIISLALLPFKAVMVYCGFPLPCLRVHFFITFGISKLRHFKNQKEETEVKFIFLLTWTRVMEFRSCKGYF